MNYIRGFMDLKKKTKQNRGSYTISQLVRKVCRYIGKQIPEFKAGLGKS